MNCGVSSHLCLPIDLFQVDAKGVKEAKHVRTKGRTTCHGRADPGEAQAISQCPEHGSVCEPVNNFPEKWGLLLIKFEVCPAVSDWEAQVINEFLKERCVQMLDHDLTGKPFPHTGSGHHQTWGNLVKVGQGGFRFLREVHSITGI